MVISVRVPICQDGAVDKHQVFQVDTLSDRDVEVVQVHVADFKQLQRRQAVVVEIEEVFDSGINRVGFVV